MANIAEDLQKILTSRYGKDVRQAIHDSISDINDIAEGQEEAIIEHTEDAEAWAKGTKDGTAVTSTDEQYHNNSKYYSEQSEDSSENAEAWAVGTKGGTAVASTDEQYHNNAKYYSEVADDESQDAEAWAKGTKDGTAVTSTDEQYHNNSKYYSEQSEDSSEDAEAWAVGQRGGVDVTSGDETYENNAKYWQQRANYWYQQARSIAESFSGALRPMGTVTFANLPSLASADAGDMYNVSDEFTTTSDFEEGAGHVIPLGSNVYKTNGGKWDVLAGSPVTGVKGDSESYYRTGNVSITKANIGLGNVPNTDFTTDVENSYKTSDSVSVAIADTDYVPLADNNGNKKKSLWSNIVSILLGTTDISSIGDGSVTGAIKQVNEDLTKHSQHTIDNITSALSNLTIAISEQNLEKYGYKIGDYFVGPTASYKYYLAHMNPYKSDQTHYTVTATNHIGLVVDTGLSSAWLSSGTAGSYKDSTLQALLKGTVLNNIKTDMIALFGGSTGLEHLIATDKLWNSMGSWAWSSSDTKSEYITAMTESMVYGAPIWSGDNYQQGEGYFQLELFRKFNYTEIFGYVSVWLRSLSSASFACYANANGAAYNGSLSYSLRASGLILFK